MPRLLTTLFLAIARTLWISVRAVVASSLGLLTRDRADRWLSAWARKLLQDVDARIEVVGRENLDPLEPIIVMSNHQSLYDIPVIFDVVPMSVRMVTKMELFRVPIWGHAMRAAGFISVDRGNREKAIRSLAEAKRRVREGIAVWIAPEGTRSRDGRLGELKRGGFILARDLGVPVLPISIEGTRDILPARTFRFNFGAKIRVTIHPRLKPEDCAGRDEMMERVRTLLQTCERGL